MMDKGSYALLASQDREFQRTMRQLRIARTKTVIHHETCPRCGAKLVNLYRQSVDDSMWMCRACWDKYNAGNEVDVSESRSARCKTCQVQVEASVSAEPAACAWYVANVVCGDKSVKSCPNYKPVEVDSNG